MFPGVETNLDNMFLAQTAQSDYEELCRMDVLGLQDTPVGDQKVVHEEFLEQLRRDPKEGWHESGLSWKGGSSTPTLKRSEQPKTLGKLGATTEEIQPVTSLVGWLDSSVALHWIRGEGKYKMFVANKVNKILEHEGVTWRHVPSKNNPADVASRGGLIDEEN